LIAAEKRRSLKKTAREINQFRATIPSLKSTLNGSKITSRHGIESEIEKFYSALFASRRFTPHPTAPFDSSSTPAFMISEIKESVRSFPNGKSPGEDKISADFLKHCDDAVLELIASRFTRYVRLCTTPDDWRNSKTTLIHKKGDKEDLETYRPITILPVLYKLFTKCILRRIRNTLEEAQPIEQAGFRRSFSTMDHIATLQKLLEIGREHSMPITLVFIDYHKAFDSIEPAAVWTNLRDQGVEEEYIRILEECYKNCSTTIRPFYKNVRIPITRGVRQGDPISPNLFASCLEGIFRQLNWDKFGVLIDGRKLNHLRFADDIVLISHSPQEATTMLNELVNASSSIGLMVNKTKTKSMRNHLANTTPVLLNNTPLEDTTEYVYLGRLLTTSNELLPEIHRRRKAAWAAFNNIKCTTDHLTCSKTRATIFDTHVLPALCYGSEQWTTTKALENRVRVSHAALERRLIGITLTEQREKGIHGTDIRQISRVSDPLKHVLKSKLRWAGHVARRTDNRWTTATMEWYPRDWKRPVGRPPMRWNDSLRKNHCTRDPNGRIVEYWTTRAKNRNDWKDVIRAASEERID
jgi:hypothetical protein